MKLKITHITQFLGVGGLEKVLELLIEEQIRAGHEVKLIVYDYEQSWVDSFRSKGVIVETDYKKKNGYDFGLLKYLANKIEGSDVVHTHDINPALYVAPLRIFFRLADKKFPRFIHTAHGMDHIHKRPITHCYEAFVSHMTDLTVGVGKAVCDVYRNLGVPAHKIALIENGTRLTSSLNKESHKIKICQELGIDPKLKLWGAIARIVPLKNQKLILNFAKKRPDIHVLLVGPSGDDAYWSELEELKPQNVTMVGSRSDIPQILAALDVFISASTHEGIPLSVLEAGAQSLPCVLSDIPGHRTLQDQATVPIALFFNNDDLEDLYLQTRLLSDAQAMSLGQQLHYHVEKNYSATAMYQKYLDAYKGINV